jgi:hypothetical protein
MIHELKLPGGSDDAACEDVLKFLEKAAKKPMRQDWFAPKGEKMSTYFVNSSGYKHR